GFVDVKTKGCLKVTECNQTSQVNFPASSSNSTVYSMFKTCCATDLCNAAPGLPGASGLSLALATITALFGRPALQVSVSYTGDTYPTTYDTHATVDSLTCNKCSYGLVGFCLSNSQVTCGNSSDVCFTAKTTFPSISSSVGFNTQGCRAVNSCNMTTNANITVLNIAYQTQIDCCSTDKCNPTQVSGAPTTKMTLTAAVGVAVLASVWGSIL
ncbi:hypothetical protein L3Q82_015132, partial [Scortum barcoo]